MKPCKIDGCVREARSGRDMCHMHAKRLTDNRGIGPSGSLKRDQGSGSVARGYVTHSIGGRRVLEHVLAAEMALGKRLPPGAVVHHIDGNGLNNSPDNLVVCPSQAYHRMVHKRQDALSACGHAGWLKCKRCGEYDSPGNMKVMARGEGERAYHLRCDSERNLTKVAAIRAKQGGEG